MPLTKQPIMIETTNITNPRLLLTAEQRTQLIEQSKANELLIIKLEAKAMATDLVRRLERDAEKGDIHTWDHYIMRIPDTPDSWLNKRIAKILKEELAVFLPGTYLTIKSEATEVQICCMISGYQMRVHSDGSLLTAERLIALIEESKVRLPILMQARARDAAVAFDTLFRKSVKKGKAHTYTEYVIGCYDESREWERKCITEAFKVALSEFLPSQYLLTKTKKSKSRVVFDTQSL